MVRYKLTIEYDGSNYAGWQKQEGRRTIQETIEQSIYKIAGENVELFVSGRTDAGVHAINQVAHFDLQKEFKVDTIIEGLNFYLGESNRLLIKQWRRANKDIYLNPFLPQDITIKNCEIVDENFHARFSSKMRYYKYLILNRQRPSALWQNKAWHIKKELNIDKMSDACKILIGKYDFSSFRDSQCQAKSPIKTINFCDIKRDDEIITFNINAKSFLHHMIRNIVGTLRDVGIGRITVEEFKEILNAKDRKKAGEMAKACGLYLVKIDY